MSENEQKSDNYQACLDRAFLLITIRMQSEHEFWEKLGKKFTKTTVDQAISRLRELGYIDDKKFASLWIESRAKSRGPELLRAELSKRGIKREIIAQSLAILDTESQVSAAKLIVASKNKPDYTEEERFKKLGGLLARRGFSYDIIKKTLNKE